MEQTVQKALNLLEALVRSGQPRRLTELSRELGLTKPNVYRLLSTLSVLGYVKKDPLNSLYSPTLKLWEMGSMLVRDVDLVSVAGPRLRKLSSDCHESVQLAVFDGGFVVYVDKVDSAQPLKAITSIGSRVPASVTSTGKAMLAWLGDEALDQAAQHVKRYTPLTLVRRKDIEHDLEETRARGYSINRGEFRAGVCGIAVPIRDRTGAVVAAVGVWGAEKNIIGSRRDELAHLTMAAARDISQQLGHIEAAVDPQQREAPARAPALAKA
ncbi:MAG TPA: IclR family transcriptional regulator [Usitatibacter sp.]|jgi:IclR family KDG regulon transcriptional repressor|nr:IclR family transcriptional regulator [Usitatibacter sp.]